MKAIHETNMEELGLTEEQLAEIISQLEVVELEIEKMQGVYYAWNRQTNEFLGQGADRHSLIERITAQAKHSVAYRFPKNHAEIFGDPETP